VNPYQGPSFEDKIEFTQEEFEEMSKIEEVSEASEVEPIDSTESVLDHATRVVIQAIGMGNQPAHYTDFLYNLLKIHGHVAPDLETLSGFQDRLKKLEMARGFVPDIRGRPHKLDDLEKLSSGR